MEDVDKAQTRAGVIPEFISSLPAEHGASGYIQKASPSLLVVLRPKIPCNYHTGRTKNVKEIAFSG